MKQTKVQNLRALREEMKAVARGERLAPADASKPSFNSVEAVVRLLTPANRRLLALIRDRKPRFGRRIGHHDGTSTTELDSDAREVRGHRLHHDENGRPPQDAERRRQKDCCRD